MAAVGEIAPTSTVPLERVGDDRHRRFAVWTIACASLTTVAVVVVSLVKTHGHIVYTIDDGGIHLSLARNLGLHGTWGVVPHHFQSASSSPLWTVLLACCARVLPRSAFEYSPLLLSTLAAAWLLVLLAYEQTIFGTRRAVLEIAAVGTLSVAVLFLPGLEMTGMEHVLHAALVVQAVALFTASARADHAPRWTAYGALALASFARYETLFVAAGLALAQLLLVLMRQDGPVRPRAWVVACRRAVMIGAAASIPVVIIGLISIAFGQQFFPNSVIAKSALGGGTNAKTINFFDGLAAIGRDPIVLTLFLAAVCYLAADMDPDACTGAWCPQPWSSSRSSFTASWRTTGGSSAIRDLVRARTLLRPRSRQRGRRSPARTCFCSRRARTSRSARTHEIPVVVEHANCKRRHLRAALPGRAVPRALLQRSTGRTGELGYISYFHRGPLTDFFGLGDHEVLLARGSIARTPPIGNKLVKDRGVKIVVVYPRTLLFDTPASWTLVGLWRLDLPNVTAFDETLQFWAPDKSMVLPILHQLEESNTRASCRHRGESFVHLFVTAVPVLLTPMCCPAVVWVQSTRLVEHAVTGRGVQTTPIWAISPAYVARATFQTPSSSTA